MAWCHHGADTVGLAMVVRIRNGVTIDGKGMAALVEQLKELASLEVLVGFPEDTAHRDTDEGPTNPQIAYIQDQGAPEQHIPARPFMKPGIESVQAKLAYKLRRTITAVLENKSDALQIGLTQVGITAVLGIQNKINEGIPPPLAEATLRGRLRSKRRDGAGARKGAAIELDRRWDGQVPSVEFAKPLVDTAQLRNAVSYAIRRRRLRGRNY